MKSIKTKLLFSVGIIIIIFSALILFSTYELITASMENLTKQQLSLGLNFDLAIREYVAEKVRPLMYTLVAEGEFIPETMSTSFVARSIFEKVRKKFPDYIIKFSAENPRNPVNQAGPEELNMIKYFNENPHKKIWTGEIAMGGKPYIATFSARRMEKACLYCHGDPADAPESLKKTYGSAAGFHLLLGKVIGLDTIAIPLDKMNKSILSETVNNFVVLGFALLALFMSLTVVLRLVIINRLSKIAQHFKSTVILEGNASINPVEVEGNDEISIMTDSFNALAARSNDAYRLLESKVAERTRKLLKANEQMELKIYEREQMEKQIKSALNEKVVLLREVHHRVKNNMQVIISLLQLQAGKIKDKTYTDMLKEIQERIRSMAMIHERFYQSKGFADIDFGDYVDSLAKSLFIAHGVNSGNIRLKTDVEECLFDLENAIPCGLIVNELISNALKHAFPNGGKGEIKVVLRAIDGDKIELKVIDTGIGMASSPDYENTKSIGLELVKVLVEHQLGGKIEVKREHGTQFCVTFNKLKQRPGI